MRLATETEGTGKTMAEVTSAIRNASNDEERLADFNAQHWIKKIDEIKSLAKEETDKRALERIVERLQGIVASILIGPNKNHPDVDKVTEAKEQAVQEVKGKMKNLSDGTSSDETTEGSTPKEKTDEELNEDPKTKLAEGVDKEVVKEMGAEKLASIGKYKGVEYELETKVIKPSKPGDKPAPMYHAECQDLGIGTKWYSTATEAVNEMKRHIDESIEDRDKMSRLASDPSKTIELLKEAKQQLNAVIKLLQRADSEALFSELVHAPQTIDEEISYWKKGVAKERMAKGDKVKRTFSGVSYTISQMDNEARKWEVDISGHKETFDDDSLATVISQSEKIIKGFIDDGLIKNGKLLSEKVDGEVLSQMGAGNMASDGKFNWDDVPFDRKPSELSDVGNTISKSEFPYDKIPKIQYESLFKGKLEKDDLLRQTYLPSEFSISVPQRFILVSKYGQFLVDTQGYNYARYVCRID